MSKLWVSSTIIKTFFYTVTVWLLLQKKPRAKAEIILKQLEMYHTDVNVVSSIDN